MHTGTPLTVATVKPVAPQFTWALHTWQVPTDSQLRIDSLEPSAAVLPMALCAQPVPTVIPSAGQPQAMPVETTPAALQLCSLEQGLLVVATNRQSFASLAQWPKVAPPIVGQKSPSVGGVPHRGSDAQPQTPLLQV